MAEVKIQSGIIMTGAGEAQLEHTLAIPSPDPGQVLIKVRAIALNTPDWMALDYFGRPGAGMGFDFAGEVVEIGANGGIWIIGDRVAGFVHACMFSPLKLPTWTNEIPILGHAANYANGSFREYLLADADLLIRLPGHLSFAEASTLGMGVSTTAQALYQWLPLPLPTCDATLFNETILIYGGSTATGSIAIQLAKLSVDCYMRLPISHTNLPQAQDSESSRLAHNNISLGSDRWEPMRSLITVTRMLPKPSEH